MTEESPEEAFPWTRGYFVRTVGIDRAKAEEYVLRQLEEDKREDGDPQLDLHWN